MAENTARRRPQMTDSLGSPLGRADCEADDNIWMLEIEVPFFCHFMGQLIYFSPISKVVEIKFAFSFLFKSSQNTPLQGDSHAAFPIMGFSKMLFFQDSVWDVQPAACGPHAAQGGCECSPTQNHKFT